MLVISTFDVLVKVSDAVVGVSTLLMSACDVLLRASTLRVSVLT